MNISKWLFLENPGIDVSDSNLQEILKREKVNSIEKIETTVEFMMRVCNLTQKERLETGLILGLSSIGDERFSISKDWNGLQNHLNVKNRTLINPNLFFYEQFMLGGSYSNPSWQPSPSVYFVGTVDSGQDFILDHSFTKLRQKWADINNVEESKAKIHYVNLRDLKK